jgi:hypothetical protein
MMNFNEIAKIWNSQDTVKPALDEHALGLALRNEHRREERKMFWLTIQEVIPAVFLVLFLGYGSMVAKQGAWALYSAAILCLGVGAFLLTSTLCQRVREAKFGESVKDHLARALSQVRHREWLYEQIMWWYLLPGVLSWGLMIFEFGLKRGV